MNPNLKQITKNRGYFVHNNDEDQGAIAVVATTAKEAKKIAYKSGEFIYGDTNWISIHVRWVRDADVSDLPIGVISFRTALLRGIYGRIDEFPCDECGEDEMVQECNGRVLCVDCIEKEYAMER